MRDRLYESLQKLLASIFVLDITHESLVEDRTASAQLLELASEVEQAMLAISNQIPSETTVDFQYVRDLEGRFYRIYDGTTGSRLPMNTSRITNRVDALLRIRRIRSLVEASNSHLDLCVERLERRLDALRDLSCSPKSADRDEAIQSLWEDVEHLNARIEQLGFERFSARQRIAESCDSWQGHDERET